MEHPAMTRGRPSSPEQFLTPMSVRWSSARPTALKWHPDVEGFAPPGEAARAHKAPHKKNATTKCNSAWKAKPGLNLNAFVHTFFYFAYKITLAVFSPGFPHKWEESTCTGNALASGFSSTKKTKKRHNPHGAVSSLASRVVATVIDNLLPGVGKWARSHFSALTRSYCRQCSVRWRTFGDRIYRFYLYTPQPFQGYCRHEGDTTVKTVGRFLQAHLKKLQPADPFLVHSSNEVVKMLEQNIPEATAAFSIDIDDLYYNLPHGGIFKAIRELIEERGEVNFQNLKRELIPKSSSSSLTSTCNLQLSNITIMFMSKNQVCA